MVESGEPDDTASKLDENSIKFKYKESDNYRTHPASSVRGGVQPSGDFLYEFFVERYETPEADVYNLTDDGTLDSHVRSESMDAGIIREKEVGVQMSQKSAFDLAVWTISNLLGEGVKEVEVENAIMTEFEEHLVGGDSNE